LSSEERLDAAVSELVGEVDQDQRDGDGERRDASDEEAFYSVSRGARRHMAESDMGNPLATLMDRGVQTSRSSGGELTTAFSAPARSPFATSRLPNEGSRQVRRAAAIAAPVLLLALVVGVYVAAPTLLLASPSPSIAALRGGAQHTETVPSEEATVDAGAAKPNRTQRASLPGEPSPMVATASPAAVAEVALDAASQIAGEASRGAPETVAAQAAEVEVREAAADADVEVAAHTNASISPRPETPVEVADEAKPAFQEASVAAQQVDAAEPAAQQQPFEPPATAGQAAVVQDVDAAELAAQQESLEPLATAGQASPATADQAATLGAAVPPAGVRDAAGAVSCKDIGCGGVQPATAACFCESGCAERGDCCADFESTCQGASIAQVTSAVRDATIVQAMA